MGRMEEYLEIPFVLIYLTLEGIVSSIKPKTKKKTKNPSWLNYTSQNLEVRPESPP